MIKKINKKEEQKRTTQPLPIEEIKLSSLEDLAEFMSQDFFLVEVSINRDSRSIHRDALLDERWYLFKNEDEAIQYAKQNPSSCDGQPRESTVSKGRFQFIRNSATTLTLKYAPLKYLNYDD